MSKKALHLLIEDIDSCIEEIYYEIDKNYYGDHNHKDYEPDNGHMKKWVNNFYLREFEISRNQYRHDRLYSGMKFNKRPPDNVVQRNLLFLFTLIYELNLDDLLVEQLSFPVKGGKRIYYKPDDKFNNYINHGFKKGHNLLEILYSFKASDYNALFKKGEVKIDGKTFKLKNQTISEFKSEIEKFIEISGNEIKFLSPQAEKVIEIFNDIILTSNIAYNKILLSSPIYSDVAPNIKKLVNLWREWQNKTDKYTSISLVDLLDYYNRNYSFFLSQQFNVYHWIPFRSIISLDPNAEKTNLIKILKSLSGIDKINEDCIFPYVNSDEIINHFDKINHQIIFINSGLKYNNNTIDGYNYIVSNIKSYLKFGSDNLNFVNNKYPHQIEAYKGLIPLSEDENSTKWLSIFDGTEGVYENYELQNLDDEFYDVESFIPQKAYSPFLEEFCKAAWGSKVEIRGTIILPEYFLSKDDQEHDYIRRILIYSNLVKYILKIENDDFFSRILDSKIADEGLPRPYIALGLSSKHIQKEISETPISKIKIGLLSKNKVYYQSQGELINQNIFYSPDESYIGLNDFINDKKGLFISKEEIENKNFSYDLQRYIYKNYDYQKRLGDIIEQNANKTNLIESNDEIKILDKLNGQADLFNFRIKIDDIELVNLRESQYKSDDLVAIESKSIVFNQNDLKKFRIIEGRDNLFALKEYFLVFNLKKDIPLTEDFLIHTLTTGKFKVYLMKNENNDFSILDFRFELPSKESQNSIINKKKRDLYEEEVGELNKKYEFNENEAKDEFKSIINDINHDLKNHINRLYKLVGKDNEKRLINKIKIIEAYLNKMSYESIPKPYSIDELTSDIQECHPDIKIHFNQKLKNHQLKIDAQTFLKIYDNIITNFYKHSEVDDKGIKIEIRENDNMFQWIFSNNGIPWGEITKEQFIIKRKGKGGSIINNAVNSSGGKFDIKNRNGKFSCTYIIELPIHGKKQNTLD